MMEMLMMFKVKLAIIMLRYDDFNDITDNDVRNNDYIEY